MTTPTASGDFAPTDELELDADVFEDDDLDDDLDDLDDDEDDEAGIEVVVLDMAGTTVADEGLVVAAFQRAVERTGIIADEDLDEALDFVIATMGQSKIEVFRSLTEGDETDAQRANEEFERAYGELIVERGIEEIEGARDVLIELRDAGASVVLTTGFAPATRDAILAALGWENLVDAALSPADVGRGRPAPDMALTALIRSEASSVAALAVVGDTRSDIESGLNAGAGFVVGVLTGAHTREELEDAGAHVVIESIADLPALLGLRD